MSLQSGSRIGHYQVGEVIGSGGMGEVYRATDTTLDRDVAIKALPRAFAADATRIARFEQEAKVLAALNHPNIAQIYGLERSGDTTAIVMELVEGPTLADRIAQGAIPADEALAIAMQIAAALEAAHDKGIVHRDLKPANIKLRADGTVKVLDFGIAKAFDPGSLLSGPQSPVMTTPVTQAGVILGTAAYMSPEQARGKPVDQRADIWAFGCVLFEMLTGQPVFAGEDVSVTLARVLERDTDLKSIPSAISPAVRHTIGLCLRKDPRKRLHSIADVRLSLAGDLMPETGWPNGENQATAQPFWRRALPFAAGLVLGSLIVGAALRESDSAAPLPSVTRYSEPIVAVVNLPGIAISDDGQVVAYVDGVPPRLMIRNIDDFDARELPEATVSNSLSVPVPTLCFSPDSAWIAHWALGGRELRRTPLDGGRGLRFAGELTATGLGCDWADDGFIYFGTGQGIARLPATATDRQPELVTRTDGGAQVHGYPQLLPGGELLYTVLTGSPRDPMDIAIVDLETNQDKILLQDVGHAQFAQTADGNAYLLYGVGDELFAAPFDIESRTVGASRRVLDRIMGIGALSFVALSRTGTLVYFDGPLSQPARLLTVDRNRNPLGPPNEFTGWGEAALSPDGKHIATGVANPDGVTADIRIADLETGAPPARATFEGFSGSVVWPDNQRLIFASFLSSATAEPTLQLLPVDNSALAKTIGDFDTRLLFPTSISPDGELLIGTSQAESIVGQGDIFQLRVDDLLEGTSPVTDDDITFIVNEDVDESHASFSPDGNWIALVANEDGIDKVFVIPYPDTRAARIEVDIGRQPRWNPLGGELFYLVGSDLWVVDIETSPVFKALNRRRLFEMGNWPRFGTVNPEGYLYAVTPDGQGFHILAPPDNGSVQQFLRVVENWPQELEAVFSR